MNRRASLLLTAVAIGLVACASAIPGASPTPSPSLPPSSPPSAPPSVAPPANTQPAGLAGRQFVSVRVTVGGADFQLVPGSHIDLSFVDGLGARAGCNHLFGSYQIDGDTLIVGQMGQTEMGCAPALMAQDEWLTAFLGSRPTFRLAGNDLVLTSGDTVITLLDREIAEPDQPLAGITWGLSSIITGETVSSVPGGVVATLLFGADGTVTVHSGCNSGGGTYTIDGNRIDFGEIIMTDMACAGGAGQVEQAVVVVLGADNVTFEIDGASLTLIATDNGLQYSAAMDL